MKPKGIHKTHDKPPNPVPNIPADPYSDPSFSDSSSSESYESSDDEYYKRMQCAKKYKKKLYSKTHFNDPIKSVKSLHPRNLRTRRNKRS